MENVDVIIPSCNAMPYLPEAIDSALAQPGLDMTVSVIDGESTDGTSDFLLSLRDPRVRHIPTERALTPAARRNIGVQHTSAKWILFLDADDFLIPGSIQAVIDKLANSTQLMAVSGIQRFSDNGGVHNTRQYGVIEYSPGIGNVTMARSVFEKIGELDTSLAVGEFVDWMSRCRDRGISELKVETHTTMRREHSDNRSRVLKESYKVDYVEIIRRHLSRISAVNEVKGALE
jgi:glycosyltransferase involved in cell wall biosynthesis